MGRMLTLLFPARCGFAPCRVPDELRKHYLSDGEGGQYSTNLDRNRYGNDDQYLFTGEHDDNLLGGQEQLRQKQSALSPAGDGQSRDQQPLATPAAHVAKDLVRVVKTQHVDK